MALFYNWKINKNNLDFFLIENSHSNNIFAFISTKPFLLLIVWRCWITPQENYYLYTNIFFTEHILCLLPFMASNCCISKKCYFSILLKSSRKCNKEQLFRLLMLFKCPLHEMLKLLLASFSFTSILTKLVVDII